MATIEQQIRTKLYLRGFTEKQVINNRGIIGATIEEVILLFSKRLLEDQGLMVCPKCQEVKCDCDG